MGKTLDEFKADMQARLDKMKADTAAQTTIDASVLALVQNQTASIAALRQQVADLESAGVDLSVLQPALDAFDAQIAANEAEQANLATLVKTNTSS